MPDLVIRAHFLALDLRTAARRGVIPLPDTARALADLLEQWARRAAPPTAPDPN